MVGYAIFGVALLGGFSNFTQVKLAQYDVDVNWLWLALIGVALVVCLAYFDVEISARVLGVALISEVAIILIVSIAFFANAQDVAVVADPAVERPQLRGRAGSRGVLRVLVVGRLRGGAELRRGGEGSDPGHPGRPDLLVRRRRRALHVHVLGDRLGLRHEHGLVDGGGIQHEHPRVRRQDGAGRLRPLRARAGGGRWPGSSGRARSAT